MAAVSCWARMGLPFTGALYRRAGLNRNEPWLEAPARIRRGRWHGLKMRLEMRDYHQRGVYVFGRMMDLPLQLFLLRGLRPGDVCLDIGANIGLTMLLAAHAVGRTGRVHAFEPNPQVFDQLRWHIDENGLGGVVEAHPVALSDREGVMRLTVPPTGNTGAGTLGQLPPRHGGRISAAHDVRLVRGDDLLNELPDAPMLIKIDVEGHEVATFRGLSRTITTRRPAIIAEVNDEMLKASGSSAEELFALIDEWGYRTFRPVAEGSWSPLPPRLELRTVGNRWRPPKTANAVFLHPDSPHWERLKPIFRPPKQPRKPRP